MALFFYLSPFLSLSLCMSYGVVLLSVLLSIPLPVHVVWRCSFICPPFYPSPCACHMALFFYLSSFLSLSLCMSYGVVLLSVLLSIPLPVHVIWRCSFICPPFYPSPCACRMALFFYLSPFLSLSLCMSYGVVLLSVPLSIPLPVHVVWRFSFICPPFYPSPCACRMALFFYLSPFLSLSLCMSYGVVLLSVSLSILLLVHVIWRCSSVCLPLYPSPCAYYMALFFCLSYSLSLSLCMSYGVVLLSVSLSIPLPVHIIWRCSSTCLPLYPSPGHIQLLGMFASPTVTKCLYQSVRLSVCPSPPLSLCSFSTQRERVSRVSLFLLKSNSDISRISLNFNAIPE